MARKFIPYKQRAKYLINAVKRRRRHIKEMAVMYKGGACETCGYDRDVTALDFHHIEEDTKDFGIGSKGYTRSWEKVKEELDKCIMVCANCHREIHSGYRQLFSES
jgi:hypothetical protein